jgi:hypothetical protein
MPCLPATDHAALQWLRTAREPAGRLARWVLELQPYTFTFTHRPGAQHRDADALTTSADTSDADAPDGGTAVADPVPASPGDAPGTDVPALTDVDHALRADFTWAPWIGWLEGRNPTPTAPPPGVPTLHDYLALLDGHLHYVDHKASPTAAPRLIVQASMHEALLRAYHATPTAGHLGIAKTLHCLRDRFFWIGLSRDVHLYVAACTQCQQHKSPRRPTLGNLQPLPIDDPWHTVHLDTFGPLPVSDAGNAFIMVFTDHFTRWPEAFAVASNDAATAARLLVDQIIARYGAPARLLTDRGTNFMADLMALTCRTRRARDASTLQHDGIRRRGVHGGGVQNHHLGSGDLPFQAGCLGRRRGANAADRALDVHDAAHVLALLVRVLVEHDRIAAAVCMATAPCRCGARALRRDGRLECALEAAGDILCMRVRARVAQSVRDCGVRDGRVG